MATKKEPYGSYTTLLGMPQGISTPDQLMKFRKREEMEKFQRRMKEASAGLQPGDAMVFNQFAQLGKVLGDKWMGNTAQLTEQDQKGAFAVEAFNKFQDEATSKPGYEKLDATERSFVHQESMVKALQQSGQQDQALMMAADLAQKRLDYRVKSAQRSVGVRAG